MVDPERNPYIFGDPETDRYRLQTQARAFSDYLRQHAREFVSDEVSSILDLGCGEGQLGFVLRDVYPNARLVGMDSDAKAIAAANEQVSKQGVSDCEFVVGDVQEGLPSGQFDLIYASMLLLHTRNAERVLQNCYAALQPGGYLWIKDLDPRQQTSSDVQAYQQMQSSMFQGAARMGMHPFLADELPELLVKAGLEQVRWEVEEYPLGGPTDEGQAMLAISLGAAYNARHMVSKSSGVPVERLEQFYVGIANEAIRRGAPIGTVPFINVIVRRPITEQG